RVIVREAWGTKIVKDIPTLNDEFHEGWLQIRGLVDVPESETEAAITAKAPLIRTMLVNLLGTEFFEASKEAEFYKWAVDHRFYNPEEALLTVQSLNDPQISAFYAADHEFFKVVNDSLLLFDH